MARDRIRLESQEAAKATRAEQTASSETASAAYMLPVAGSLDKRASSSMRQNAVLHMQQTRGNAAVRRMLAQRSGAPAGEEGGPIDDEVTSQINSARGSGTPLSESVRAPMEQSFGADFSNVKVHTDSQSDTLNRQLSAKAFTTGSDIFFSGGAYQPGSSEGNKLVAHELTHVVQQSGSGGSGGSLTLGPAGDAYEQEADSASQAMTSQALPAVQRAGPEEDEALQRKPVQRAQPEEEEVVQAMRVQRASPEEEELPVQAMRVQREGPEEDGCENC